VPRSIIGWFVVCWSAFLVATAEGALLVSPYSASTVERLCRASTATAYDCWSIVVLLAEPGGRLRETVASAPAAG
jgi:hypothetical protein